MKSTYRYPGQLDDVSFDSPIPGETIAHGARQGGGSLFAEDVPPGALLQERWAIGGDADCAVWYPTSEAAVARLRELARPEGLEVSADGLSAAREDAPGSPGSRLWVEPVPADGRVSVGNVAPAAEVKVLAPDHVEIYLPAGATLPAEYAGWIGEQSDWDPPSGEQRLHLTRPAAKFAPTGHIRLAWLALVLLLVAPFLAVADPPPAQEQTAPGLDAGTPNFCPTSNWPCDCPGNPDCTIKPG